MQESPVRLKFWALPHFNVVRRVSHVFLFQTSGTIDGERILDVDPVLGYDFNHDGLLAVTLFHPEATKDPQPPPRLIELVGSKPIARYTDATPGPKQPFLSRLQWKIVRALIGAPRATAVELAKRTRLTARTCANHRKRLFADRFVQPSVSIQEDRSGGFPVFRVYVQGRPSAAKVGEVLGKDAVVTDTVREGKVYFAKASSMGEVILAVDRMRRLSGVEDVKLILSRGFAVAEKRLLTWCEEAEKATVAVRT